MFYIGPRATPPTKGGDPSDNYTFGKLRLTAFRFSAFCEFSISPSRDIIEPNHYLKSIDLAEISRSVVESSKWIHLDGKFYHFQVSNAFY